MQNKNILSIDYDSLTISAMRDLVKKVLGEVAKNGLQQKQQFNKTLITKFKSTYPTFVLEITMSYVSLYFIILLFFSLYDFM